MRVAKQILWTGFWEGQMSPSPPPLTEAPEAPQARFTPSPWLHRRRLPAVRRARLPPPAEAAAAALADVVGYEGVARARHLCLHRSGGAAQVALDRPCCGGGWCRV